MSSESSSPFRIAGLGEVLWDCFPDGKRPGGATSNAAFQATQLGADGLVVSRVGEDKDGQRLIEFLNQQGLSTAAIQFDPRHPTGTVTVDDIRKEAGDVRRARSVATDNKHFRLIYFI